MSLPLFIATKRNLRLDFAYEGIRIIQGTGKGENQMNSSDRVKSLAYIWAAFALATGLSFAGNAATSDNDVWMAAIFALAAGFASVIVMRLGVRQEDSPAEVGKRKRDKPSLYHLIDELDEYELAELRRRLTQTGDVEDESAALGDLMRQRHDNR